MKSYRAVDCERAKTAFEALADIGTEQYRHKYRQKYGILVDACGLPWMLYRQNSYAEHDYKDYIG